MEAVLKDPLVGDAAQRTKPRVRTGGSYLFQGGGPCGIATSLDSFGLVGVIALLAALSGSVASSANAGLLGTGDASYCPPSSMAFQPWGDRSNYMLTPGGSFEESTTSWKLGGGAKVIAGNEPYFIHAKGDRKSLYMPKGSTASTPTMCFAAGDWHMRFVGTGYGQLTVAVTRQQPPGSAQHPRRRHRLERRDVEAFAQGRAAAHQRHRPADDQGGLVALHGDERHVTDRRRLPRSLRTRTRQAACAPHTRLLTGMQSSLPVAERPRRPEWMKVRAPSADSRYFDVKKLIHGHNLLTICEEARCPNISECWGRGHRDLPDPRRHLHTRLPLLLRQLRQARAPAGPARAAAPRPDRRRR